MTFCFDERRVRCLQFPPKEMPVKESDDFPSVHGCSWCRDRHAPVAHRGRKTKESTVSGPDERLHRVMGQHRSKMIIS